MREPQEIQDEEYEQVAERVAAVDVAKASGMVCTRVPHPSQPGRRLTKVWEVEATTGAIIELGGHLAGLGSSGSRSSPPRTTCDMRVHECKWETPLEVRLMSRV
jgi:hypothetical protein